MDSKGRKSWLTVALLSMLLLSAAPGLALDRPGPSPQISFWEELAARVGSWLGIPIRGGLTSTPAAYSAGIDPNGQPWNGSSPTTGETAQGETDSSMGIDPDGRP